MSAGSGPEFLLWCRNSDVVKSLPVVVLTGSAFPPEIDQASQFGANMIMLKPGTMEEFTKRIHEVCSSAVNKQQ